MSNEVPAGAQSATASCVVLSVVYGPERLEDEIGLPATTSWHLGESRGGQLQVPQAFNGWKLSSSLPRPADPISHVQDLLGQLHSVTAALRRLSADPAVDSVKIWLQIENVAAGLSVDTTLLNALAATGASFELDFAQYRTSAEGVGPGED